MIGSKVTEILMSNLIFLNVLILPFTKVQSQINKKNHNRKIMKRRWYQNTQFWLSDVQKLPLGKKFFLVFVTIFNRPGVAGAVL